MTSGAAEPLPAVRLRQLSDVILTVSYTAAEEGGRHTRARLQPVMAAVEHGCTHSTRRREPSAFAFTLVENDGGTPPAVAVRFVAVTSPTVKVE